MTRVHWLALLLLAGCAATASPAPQACDVHKAAEIPLTLERGFITVPAKIEDKPVFMLIDTGSEGSVVTPAASSALGLQPDRHHHTTIHGTGGAITAENALLRSFEIGGMEMLGESMAVSSLPSTHAAGLLGADWLADFDVELDVAHQRMALYRVEGCPDDHVPWPGRKATLPARLTGRGLVLITAELDGHPVTALLDSGALHTLLADGPAARIGLDAAALAGDPTGHARGIDGIERTVRRHRFARFRLGPELYTNPVLLVGPLRSTTADMLLGLDWLRGNQVWISYSARRIAFQPQAIRQAE
jgi:predicted aspartyl protease